MKETIAKFCLILIFIITSSCGYKVLDNQGSKDFSIKEIKTSGDNRINFKIKNSLIINTSESKAILSVFGYFLPFSISFKYDFDNPVSLDKP